MHALGEPEHVDGAVHAGFGGLHRIELVVHGRRRTRQIEDLVHLDVEGKRDVVAHELEVRAVAQREHVLLGAGVEIVDAQHVVAERMQALAEVRSEKAGAAGDENAFTLSFHA